jgi:hypothetical protein
MNGLSNVDAYAIYNEMKNSGDPNGVMQKRFGNGGIKEILGAARTGYLPGYK